MLGKEILDVQSQGVGDVFINSFLIFTRRRYLLFCEATSVLEDLEKSHTLLRDTSQWYNSHIEKIMFRKHNYVYSLTGISKIITTLIFSKHRPLISYPCF